MPTSQMSASFLPRQPLSRDSQDSPAWAQCSQSRLHLPALVTVQLFLAALALVAIPSTAAIAAAPEFSAAEIEHFEKQIRPLLHRHCYECHSGESKTLHASLRVDRRESLAAGGDSGPALLPGKPEESLLIQVLRYDGDIQMPPQGKLSKAEIRLLTEWVRDGAPFPASAADAGSGPRQVDIEQGRKFWSFQPLQTGDLPPLKSHDGGLAEWPRSRMDHFVLAKLQEQGLRPSPPAERGTLARRLAFDLTGLPPTPEQVRALAADDSPEAVERYVEQLLESPAYGERWARHWLDLARYTDVTASWLNKTGQAHLYRDWVVEALNEDLPYDEFVRRQLAADHLDVPPDQLRALGLLGLSPTYWKELKLPAEIIKVIVADEWEERVDVVSRTFLGLTVACARCHDHKFDPITTQDFYALAGVFASSRIVERPLIGEEAFAPVRKARAAVESLEKELAALEKQKPQPPKAEPNAAAQETAKAQEAYQKALAEHEGEAQQLRQRIAQWKQTPDYNAAMAHVVSDESLYVVRAGKTMDSGTKLDYRPGPRDLPVFIRGNPNRPGEITPRRYIEVLSESEPEPFSHGSGRLDLALAITQQSAPLAARVMVNRIWLEHFGRGLVETPSNFGQLGARPSHPALLDDLAQRFIEHHWSLKWLHQEIVTSATYLQASDARDEALAVDPDNRWLWRMNRRRLPLEPWRDAMLSATGELDRRLGGEGLKIDDPKNDRRTLYASVHRRDMPQTLQIHDFPAPIAHSPRRVPTVTPLQGLFVLNSPFMQQRAAALPLQLESLETLPERVDALYWKLFSRGAEPEEIEVAKAFLGDQHADLRGEKWQQYAHALLGCNEFQFVD